MSVASSPSPQFNKLALRITETVGPDFALAQESPRRSRPVGENETNHI
ncbi:hypothetical protein PIIN_09777 [Serendipita indica DSM 11827]|uniref:Uncharacterized protein n=1 Tax=Serendipita indica (strain DSM 11827) TaxID=1109443 RepID=G4TWU6_SERID|nr:hypothetical protein PIIN_09777 [Serendipita indica DSM 11827]